MNAEDGFDSDKVWIKVDCAIDSGFEEDEVSEEKVIIVIVVNGMVVTEDWEMTFEEPELLTAKKYAEN